MFNACLSFSNNINQISRLIPEYRSHALFIGNFRYFMEYRSGIDEKADAAGGLPEAVFERDITFRNVSFYYPGIGEPALRGIDLTIKKGEKIAIVGRNGADKSTLVKLLLRFYDPTEGDGYARRRSLRFAQLCFTAASLFMFFSGFNVIFADTRAEYRVEQPL